MTAGDSKAAFRECQVALLLAAATVLLSAIRVDAGEAAGDIREAVRSLKRLESTCTTYAGPNAHKLLDAMVLEGVRLLEEAKYDGALDSILLAYALYPDKTPPTYYGLQAGSVEIALRAASKEEAALLPLDPARYAWFMAAVANLSPAKLEPAGIHATVERDGRPLTDAAGNKVESLAPDNAELKTLLGARAAELVPASVNPGETVTFVVVFPAFGAWSDIRFQQEAAKIDAAVKNYPELDRSKFVQARKLAAACREKPAKTPGTNPKPPDTNPDHGGNTGKTYVMEYVVIGRIKNIIDQTQWLYGIEVIDARLAADPEHDVFYVRRGDETIAELKRMGKGSIAQLRTKDYRPVKGDAVFIRRLAP